MHRAFRYLAVLFLPLMAAISFTSHGIWTFSAVFFVFGFLPLMEVIIGGNQANISEEEEFFLKDDPAFDYILYLMLPLQFAFLVFFLFSMREPGLTTLEITGRILAMGILCGTLGINVAHELGHRVKKLEQTMAKALLMSTLYMHFFIEHNHGHHRRVSTDGDPASARRGEVVYAFFIRSIFGSYVSAWKIQRKLLKKKDHPFLSLANEMLWYHVLQFGLTVGIGVLFGWKIMVYFILAALVGILHLELVNYIEHYGLRRHKTGETTYEKVNPQHSWNSDHLLGRIFLFELTRHSDHHYKASRKYQILKHHDNSPQMPTGYPGMMLISLLPPLWFAIMHPRIAKLQSS